MADTRENQDDRAMMETAGVSSFSELLMLSGGVLNSSDHNFVDTGADGGEDSLGFVFSGPNGSRMLCFSGECQNGNESLFLQPSLPSGVSGPHPSCTTNICQNSNDACAENKSAKSSTKRIGSVNGQTMEHNRKPSKRCKRNQEKSSVGTAKVRKERLGERIAALQQLVSPYGKTDAASVLHEAMGYIKFLQDQIHVLSSPYLINYSFDGGVVTGDVRAGKKVRDLRSRGLCLVPVSSTVLLESSNGADFWSPATMGHTTSSS
ncbi:hypothetical protein Bca4012_068486 [Brassica carinata]